MLGSLARKSEVTGGFDEVMRMLPEDTGGGVLARRFGSSDASTAVLPRVLGPGVSSIVKVLSSRLGFDVTPLMAAAVPALLRVINTIVKEQNVTSAEVTTLLKSQSAASVESATPEARAILDEAFEVSDQAEQLRATFTPSEWRAIRLSPQAVTNYVVTASPSGLSGMANELMTAGDVTAALVRAAQSTSLVDVAFGSVPDEQELGSEGTLGQEAPRASLLALVQTAAAAVRAKAPSEAKSFGAALVALSQKVAEATKEGGILGIGGTLVSEDERSKRSPTSLRPLKDDWLRHSFRSGSAVLGVGEGRFTANLRIVCERPSMQAFLKELGWPFLVATGGRGAFDVSFEPKRSPTASR